MDTYQKIALSSVLVVVAAFVGLMLFTIGQCCYREGFVRETRTVFVERVEILPSSLPAGRTTVLHCRDGLVLPLHGHLEIHEGREVRIVKDGMGRVREISEQ